MYIYHCLYWKNQIEIKIPGREPGILYSSKILLRFNGFRNWKPFSFHWLGFAVLIGWDYIVLMGHGI
jgi:hypothetical protein